MRMLNDILTDATENEKAGSNSLSRWSELRALMKQRLADAMELQMLSDRRLVTIRRRLTKHSEHLRSNWQSQATQQ